ncbi:hypothetical protein LINPERHAP2_LOCUS27440 [Linum perenne]
MDAPSAGWAGFLRLLRNWIATVIVPPPPMPTPVDSPKSFAQVTIGPCFSLQGRCVDLDIDGVPGVKVEEEGVHARLQFLEGCIVFRFQCPDENNWDDFRRWTQRNWGSASDAQFHRLGDGLWMLFCGSKVKVDRILSLNRRNFNGSEIFLDKWIPEAGRSSILLNEGVVWVTARGLPLHLRSRDLFRQLGTACGKFLGFESGDSLSSVRLKIGLSGALPEKVPISYGDSAYMVLIDPDGLPISSSHKYVLPLSSTSLGRASSSSSPILAPANPPNGQSPNFSRHEAGSSTLSSVNISSEVTEGMGDVFVAEALSEGMGDVFVAEALAEGMGSVTDANALSFNSKDKGRVGSVFLSSQLSTISAFTYRNGMENWAFGSLLSPNGKPQFKFCLRKSLGHQISNSFVWSLFDPSRPCTSVILTDLSNFSSDCTPILSSPFPSDSASLPFPQFEAFSSVGSIEAPSDPPSTDHAQLPTSDPLTSAIESVASLIGLELFGSKELGTAVAIQTSEEVMVRRSRSCPQSSTERELRRLGPSPVLLGRRCISPPSRYEF